MTTNRERSPARPDDEPAPERRRREGRAAATDEEWRVLEWELESFVCTGEYERGLERILSTYLGEPRSRHAAGRLGQRLLRQRQVALRSRPRAALARRDAALRLDRSRARAAPGHDHGVAQGALDRGQPRGRSLGRVRQARRGIAAARFASRSLASCSPPPICRRTTRRPASSCACMQERQVRRLHRVPRETRERARDRAPQHVRLALRRRGAARGDSRLRRQTRSRRGGCCSSSTRTRRTSRRTSFLQPSATSSRRARPSSGKLPCTLIVLDELQQFIYEDPTVILAVQRHRRGLLEPVRLEHPLRRHRPVRAPGGLAFWPASRIGSRFASTSRTPTSRRSSARSSCRSVRTRSRSCATSSNPSAARSTATFPAPRSPLPAPTRRISSPTTRCSPRGGASGSSC